MQRPAFWMLGLVLALWLALYSCSREQSYLPVLPEGISLFEQPEYNPISTKGFELGRKLFYDPILSGTNTVSCGTCHLQKLAFSDGQALQENGISGKQLGRHVPTLVNVAWMDGLFWDGGVPNLEFLMQAPIEHPDEMGQNLMELEKELNEHSEYPALFQEAFSADKVTFPDVSNALSQFVRGLVSFNSAYDRYKGGEEAALNAQELRGYKVYQKHCAGCHVEGLFTDNGYHNNGIDSVFDFDTLLGSYKGRFRITLDSADFGKYKTPSLRNVAVSEPYMHDGRFASLREVIAHYSTGVKHSTTLDDRLLGKDGAVGFDISEEDQEALEAFLKSLTDVSFLEDQRFAPTP